MTKLIIFLIAPLLLIEGSSQAQNHYKKQQKKIFSQLENQSLENFLKDFSKAMANYQWENIRDFFDASHYQTQSKLYLNDDFMFGYLGEKGKRDTNQVNLLYIRETLGLTQMEEKDLIEGQPIQNFYYLKEFKKIKKLFFTRQNDLPLSTLEFTFIAILRNGEKYMGKFALDPKRLKIFGSVG